MFGRRKFLGTTVGLAVTSTAGGIQSSAAVASTAEGIASAGAAKAATTGFQDLEPRGSVGRLERLARLDLESKMNFHAGFLRFLMNDMRPVVEKRVKNSLEASGLNPDDNIPGQDTAKLVSGDPVISLRQRTWLSNQQVMYKALQQELDDHREEYLTELDAAQQTGPGVLQLDPTLEIPDYARHEIHIQPGGYVGSPFAGYLNYYSVNSFYDALIGPNYQDQAQKGIAQKIPVPDQGKVARILDLGCATGRLTFAIKDRFADAEVWGLDVAAPMLRFAHLRGVDMGTEINLRQALASDTRFPDAHFDIVTANILFHETTAQVTREIMQEVFRILRPGGVFYPTDLPNGKQVSPRNAVNNYAQWIDHTLNGERWRIEWEAMDGAQAMADAGFIVDEDVAPGGFFFGRLLGTRPA